MIDVCTVLQLQTWGLATCTCTCTYINTYTCTCMCKCTAYTHDVLHIILVMLLVICCTMGVVDSVIKKAVECTLHHQVSLLSIDYYNYTCA